VSQMKGKFMVGEVSLSLSILVYVTSLVFYPILI